MISYTSIVPLKHLRKHTLDWKIHPIESVFLVFVKFSSKMHMQCITRSIIQHLKLRVNVRPLMSPDFSQPFLSYLHCSVNQILELSVFLFVWVSAVTLHLTYSNVTALLAVCIKIHENLYMYDDHPSIVLNYIVGTWKIM